MSLDKAFADLISALNANTAALLKSGPAAAPAATVKPTPPPAPAGKPAPVAGKPAPAAKPTPKPTPPPAPAAETEGEVTLADLRNIGKQLIAAKKQAEMRAMIAEYGAESLTTLDPQHFAAIKPRLEALLAGEGAPEEAPAADGL